jgi:hypothetical protein
MMNATTPFKPLTLADAKVLSHGTVLYHRDMRNADGTATRVRVSGRPKVWKTRPDEVEFPVKHGLYQSLRLNQSDLHMWSLTDPTA